MKFISLCMLSIASITLLHYTPSLCMQNHLHNPRGPLPLQRRNKHLNTKKMIISYIKISDFLLKSISPDKSYTLEELRNWVVPLTLVDKHTYNSVNRQPLFIRGVISFIAHNNDHYNEEDIARGLNSPGAHYYIQLNSQLFKNNLNPNQLPTLIKQGADINYRKSHFSGGDTPLMQRIRNKSLKGVQQLLELGVEMEHYTSIDPISLSIQNANTDIDIEIFKALMHYYNPIKSDLYFPLRYAIHRYSTISVPGNTHHTLREKLKNIIIALLEKDADATEGLLYVIEQGYFYPSLIKTLVFKYNADPNKAFSKLTEYVLTNIKAPHEQRVIQILKKSPQFNKENNAALLAEQVTHLNALKALII